MEPMTMLPGDWGLGALTLTFAITGLFRGFSGALSFVAASASATVAAMFFWGYLTRWDMAMWVRGASTLTMALLVFGIVRAIVKKMVNGLLAQPADAIFGFLLGLLLGVVIVVAWAVSGVGHEYSNIVQEVARHVG